MPPNAQSECEQMLDEILEESQRNFDNADGCYFTDADTPHYVIRRPYYFTHASRILSRRFLGLC